MRLPLDLSRAALLATLALATAGCSSRHGTGTVPTLAVAEDALADADSLAARRVAPGVTHVRAWLAAGPWSVHVLEVDTARCHARWEARGAGALLEQRALTSALSGDAIAAINADFFQLPGGTPVGAQVHQQVPLIGPSDRAAWLWDGRAFYAGTATLTGAVAAASDSIPLVQVNRALNRTSAFVPPVNGAALFTARAGRVPPADAPATRLWLRVESGNERAGSGRVERAAESATDTVPVPTGVAVLQLVGDARAWGARRSVGEVVSWRAEVRPHPAGTAAQSAAAREAVGGFPLLLRAGQNVLGETDVRPSFGAQRHPRSAIGWSTQSGRVFLVLVDGRQAPWSDGMSLPELTWLFQRLGATDALNLDGGGSSALVVQGSVVNRPSDPQGERSVGNALVLAGCR